MRVLSDEIKDLKAQRIMLANDYDVLADRAEDRASGMGRQDRARSRKTGKDQRSGQSHAAAAKIRPPSLLIPGL